MGILFEVALGCRSRLSSLLIAVPKYPKMVNQSSCNCTGKVRVTLKRSISHVFLSYSDERLMFRFFFAFIFLFESVSFACRGNPATGPMYLNDSRYSNVTFSVNSHGDLTVDTGSSSSQPRKLVFICRWSVESEERKNDPERSCPEWHLFNSEDFDRKDEVIRAASERVRRCMQENPTQAGSPEGTLAPRCETMRVQELVQINNIKVDPIPSTTAFEVKLNDQASLKFQTFPNGGNPKIFFESLGSVELAQKKFRNTPRSGLSLPGSTVIPYRTSTRLTYRTTSSQNSAGEFERIDNLQEILRCGSNINPARQNIVGQRCFSNNDQFGGCSALPNATPLPETVQKTTSGIK